MTEPADVVHRWVASWLELDASAVAELFAPDATYVSGRDGELDQLARRFRIAARSWRSVRIDDVSVDEPISDAGLSVVAGRYRFRGTDRHDQQIAYSAAFTFVLRRNEERLWRIVRMHESVLPAAPATAPAPPAAKSAGDRAGP